MNKDSFVPDHVPAERTPLPLRRSLEWVQDRPPSCSRPPHPLTALPEKAAVFPGGASAIAAATTASSPLCPDSREELLTAQRGRLFPL